MKFGLQVANLNTSVVTPIPKKNNITDNPDDYRPISVSCCFAQLYETLLLDKIEAVFKFSPNQFGYREFTSCKHATFVLNETRQHLLKGDSPCYITNLDMRKAFDKLWRNGLFYKLSDKIKNEYWRAIINYYSSSRGIVKIENRMSGEF